MISILSSKAAPSKVVDGVTKSREVLCLVGLSSDTKPTTSYRGILICNGSLYDEIDTGKEYLYDEAGGEWHEQPDGDKKKDDPTAEDISVSAGAADAGKVIVVGSDGKLHPVDLNSTGEFAIDKTLKVAGAAADAKETGDAISALNGSLGTLEENLFNVTDIKEYVTLENGTVANSNNTNAVRTNFISVSPGQTVEIFPVRPLTEGTHYRYAYRTLDENDAILTNNATAQAAFKKVTITRARKIRFSIAVYDSSGSTAESLRADTYGYDAYVVISNETSLKSTVMTHISADMEDRLSQSRYSDTSGARILTILHFSDNHGNKRSAEKALEVFSSFTGKIDDILHAGDTVSAKLSDGIQNWIDSGCANKVLNAVGNHDTYATNGTSSAYLLTATQEEVYNVLFAPYISGWGVEQPVGVDDSTSAYYCACYYYKDYTSPKIRLIVLDSERWTAEELAWFTETLEDARTKGYAVVVASHCLPGTVVGLADSNYNYVGSEDLDNPYPAYAKITEDAAEALDTFVENGGVFMAWLAGHYHRGGFGYLQNHPNIFVMTAEKAGTARTSGQARKSGEKNEYSFNIITFDPSDGYIRMVRYGADVDAWLRGRHVFCYDYINKRIVAQW